MASAKVLAKVKSAASCGSVLPCGAGQCAFVPGTFSCPAETSSLVRKWKKGLTMNSKQMVCNGKHLTISVSGPALVMQWNGCRTKIKLI